MKNDTVRNKAIFRQATTVIVLIVVLRTHSKYLIYTNLEVVFTRTLFRYGLLLLQKLIDSPLHRYDEHRIQNCWPWSNSWMRDGRAFMIFFVFQSFDHFFASLLSAVSTPLIILGMVFFSNSVCYNYPNVMSRTLPYDFPRVASFL